MGDLRSLLFIVLLLGVLAAWVFPGAVGAEQPWPKDVPGHIAPAPGEHPRLFFRKADLPALKKRAATADGKAIIERLKVVLGGGDKMPARPTR